MPGPMPMPGPPRGGYQVQARKPRIGHFDPDELTRRLHGVLAEQRAHAERKRRTREAVALAAEARAATSSRSPRTTAPAPNAPLTSNPPHVHPSHSQQQHQHPSRPDDLASSSSPGASGDYHHVPREAARQFTRTTTQELMREHAHIHEIHQRALKMHMDVRAAHTPDTSVNPSEFARMRVPHQPQHQRRTGSDATAAMMMASRNRQTMMHGHNLLDGTGTWRRRNSTGCDPAMVDRTVVTVEAVAADGTSPGTGSDGTTPPDEPVQQFPPEPRTDWTQSDEATARHNNSRPKTMLLSPLLRKADSLWGLRSRLKKDAAGQEGTMAQEGQKEKEKEKEQVSSPGGSKSPRKFFSKFIR
ncbi:hypothetical protein B0T16DRAFT_405634 [Cercophora newfieldiana]|uniref:Uncharacterized protein n=1 Tax=Cercophora newfieldiana TaxID=92897 RepID=A0AA39YGF5_9PEZI|nr:hypothetical protein B0T16DRAFT_405634 [Cercophora newfieldiana]